MGMISDKTSLELSLVYPDLAVRWKRVNQDMFNYHGKPLIVVQGIRTFVQQMEYYTQGREQLSDGSWVVKDPSAIITWAQSRDSFHPYGLALDCAFKGADPYLKKLNSHEQYYYFSEYGYFCKAYGLEWGGDWEGEKQDLGHCQITYGMQINEIQTIYTKLRLKGVWKACDRICQK